MNIAFFIPPLLLLGYLSYRNTNHGIYVLLATIPGYLLRLNVWIVPTTWLELAIYVVAAVSLYKHIKRKTLASHWYYVLHHARVYIIPILLFVVSALFAAGIAKDATRALGIIKAWYFDPLLFSILLLDKLTNKLITARVYYALSVSAIPIMAYGFFEYATMSGLTIPGRLDSFFESPNYAAMYLAPLILLFGGRFIMEEMREKSLSRNLYSILWVCAALAAIVLTKSFGGLFGLFGGAVFFAIFYKKPTAKKIITLSALFIIVTALGFFGYQNSKTHYNAFWKINSLNTRVEVWTHTLTMITRSPIIGVGQGGFHDAYQTYVSDLPPKLQPIEKDVLWPHNIYLTILVENGVVALSAFLWILAIFYFETFRRDRAIIPACAMTSIVLHGLVDTPYLKNDLSLVFWIIIVASIASRAAHPKKQGKKTNPALETFHRTGLF